MSVLGKIYFKIRDIWEEISILRLKKNEIEKFKDPRRVAISKDIDLTEEEKKLIDELFVNNYGKKIPYTWHRHYKAFTGSFDVNYFPELLYIPEFERFQNLWTEYVSVFSDKNMLTILAQKANVKTVENIVSVTKGMIRDRNNRQITKEEAVKVLENIDKVFVKPTVESNSGEGCQLTTIRTMDDFNDICKDLGDDFAIQECLICHESIRKLYDGSVNTFRVITYRWRDEIKFVPSVMRMGKGGGCLDNAHAGGMFIGISDSGILRDKAYTEFRECYEKHPDSNIEFKSYSIPLFPKVLEAAKKMHEALPQVGSINWDFTIDNEGKPVLIEINTRGGGIWISELAHGKGPFGEMTAEILQWIRLMEETPASSRKMYAFGNIPC